MTTPTHSYERVSRKKMTPHFCSRVRFESGEYPLFSLSLPPHFMILEIFTNIIQRAHFHRLRLDWTKPATHTNSPLAKPPDHRHCLLVEASSFFAKYKKRGQKRQLQQ